MAVILIVDDEPLQRDILKTILSDEGYETYSAASGEEALKLARTYEPDVVLSDLKMGKMDGIELLEKLKGLKQAPTVLIMTAFGTIDSAVDAMKKGSKIRERFSFDTPTPVSLRRSTNQPFCSSVAIVSDPPPGMAWKALVTTLNRQLFMSSASIRSLGRES